MSFYGEETYQFDVMEDGEVYCRGLVIDLSGLMETV